MSLRVPSVSATINGLRYLVLIFVLAPCSNPVMADSPLQFGQIHINRRNIFDSGQSSDHQFPYSWVNALHIKTKESVVRAELLFKEGDPFDQECIAETERQLRMRPLFRSVKISTAEPVNGKVDVLIETEDVWTTLVRMSYSLAAGGDFYSFGIMERNFLGTGRQLGAFVQHDIDRLTRGAIFKDPHLFKGPYELFGGYGRDEKGEEWEVSLKRDFVSLKSPQAEGVGARRRSDEDRLFENGDEVATFDHHEREVKSFVSRLISTQGKTAHRLGVGQKFKEDRFNNPKNLPEAPPNHTVSAVLIGYQFFQSDYEQRFAVTTYDRDEDINVGWDILVEAGPSLKAIGALVDGVVGGIKINKTFVPSNNVTSFFRIDTESRFERGAIINGNLRGLSKTVLTPRVNNLWILAVSVECGRNLDAETQVLLGGESGLRGYSVRQFSGNKRWLFSVERQQIWVRDWLRLLNCGGALFADAGYVWKQGVRPELEDLKKDVGFGLRLSPSKSFDASLIRIDVAYAFDDNRQSSPWVLNIGGSTYFGKPNRKKFDF